MPSGELRIRPMRSSDVEAGMRLKEAARWNQVPADWRGYLQLQPEGCFAGEVDHHVVATTTAFAYGHRVGWIGMVLVDPEFRRRGIATRMMEHAISYLEAFPCTCIKLDATEAGAAVYGRMGFVVEYQVERWRRAPQAVPPVVSAKAPADIPLDDIDPLGEWDGQIFGADRSRLLRWYCESRYPAFILGSPERRLGYVLGRPGSNAFQIGPMAAQDPATAERLLAHALSVVGGQPMIVDVAVPNTDAVSLLPRFGFERFRVLQRMFRGENRFPGKLEKVYCLAGFEFG